MQFYSSYRRDIHINRHSHTQTHIHAYACASFLNWVIVLKSQHILCTRYFLFGSQFSLSLSILCLCLFLVNFCKWIHLRKRNINRIWSRKDSIYYIRPYKFHFNDIPLAVQQTYAIAVLTVTASPPLLTTAQ